MLSMYHTTNTNPRKHPESPKPHSGAYGIDVRQAVVLSYSGLRGAVGLTLAIAIHQDEAIHHSTRDRCV